MFNAKEIKSNSHSIAYLEKREHRFLLVLVNGCVYTGCAMTIMIGKALTEGVPGGSHQELPCP